MGRYVTRLKILDYGRQLHLLSLTKKRVIRLLVSGFCSDHLLKKVEDYGSKNL